MRCAPAFFLLVLFGAGCKPPKGIATSLPISPATNPTTNATQNKPLQEERRYAMFWGDSMLYRAPNEGAVSGKLSDARKRGENTDASNQWVFLLVGESGDFYRVKPLSEPYLHSCHDWNITSLSPFDITLYVKKSDAIPVIHTATKVSLPGARSITLLPGSIALPNADGTFFLLADHLSLTAQIPKENIKDWYPEIKPITRPQMLFLEKDLSQGGVIAAADIFAGYADIPDRPSFVTVFTKCSEYTIKKPIPEPSEDEGGVLGGVYGGAVKDTSVRKVASGAALFWPDGEAAGETTFQISLYEQPIKNKDLSCFPLLSRESSLMICVREDSFVK
jgi:hypothetical protein